MSLKNSETSSAEIECAMAREVNSLAMESGKVERA